jgi:hypothetical protein
MRKRIKAKTPGIKMSIQGGVVPGESVVGSIEEVGKRFCI